MALIITPGQIQQRADFYFQLQSLVAAGVPMIQALEMVGRNPPARSYRPRIQELIGLLQQGSTLTEGARAQQAWLPEFDLALIAAGEQSGRLDSIFRHLGQYYKERAELMRRVLSNLLYPAFIIHLAILVFPVNLLQRMVWRGEMAPFLTQKLFVLIPLYLILLAVIVAGQGTHRRGWRALVENILNGVPALGSARKHLALARFSGALEALIAAGVPIIRAWDLAADASGSTRIQNAVGKMKPEVLGGATPAEALRRTLAFPEMFKNLYASGEMSGQLDSTMHRLHYYFQEQASLKYQNIGQWVPRILFMVIAIVIGYSVIRFYMNYFGQLENILGAGAFANRLSGGKLSREAEHGTGDRGRVIPGGVRRGAGSGGDELG